VFILRPDRSIDQLAREAAVPWRSSVSRTYYYSISRHASPHGGFSFHVSNGSLNSPACSCVSITLPKGNLSYLAIIRRCATVEAEFQIVAGRRFAKQKRVTDENNSFVT
jgi:hypothetical protein